MKADFEKATLNIWFQGQAVSRNIPNVVEMNMEGSLAIIKTAEDNHYFTTMSNVNLIEEVG